MPLPLLPASRPLGPDVPLSRVLHVGDSLLHDIAGANAAGVDSRFVAGGIHAEELGLDVANALPTAMESTPSAEALERVLGDYPGVQPTHTVATFRW